MSLRKHEEVRFGGSRLRDLPSGSIYIVSGEAPILALQSLLVQFSERCGNGPGTLLDLPYFLQKPGLMKRIPHLYLVSRRSGVAVGDLTPEDLAGTILLLEYRVFGFGTKAYATNDRSGSGTLLAAPQDRVAVAQLVCETLMSRGAAVTMLSFLGDSRPDAIAAEKSFQLRCSGPLLHRLSWAVRTRSAPAYLPLHGTMDATLAGMGQKTRSNMRYYRRRAEKELGCTPVQQVEATAEELVAFNAESMYPVGDHTLLWRLKVLKALHDPFLMGMKDRDGRWLSVVGGRRFGETSEILWQMNRAGYPAHSFGTAMRSYCMEFEIARGAKRLQVEGGTFHSMHHSFTCEEIVDLVVVRSYSRRLMQLLAKRMIPWDNQLAQMLKNPDLQWHDAQPFTHGAPKPLLQQYAPRVGRGLR